MLLHLRRASKSPGGPAVAVMGCRSQWKKEQEEAHHGQQDNLQKQRARRAAGGAGLRGRKRSVKGSRSNKPNLTGGQKRKTRYPRHGFLFSHLLFKLFQKGNTGDPRQTLGMPWGKTVQQLSSPEDSSGGGIGRVRPSDALYVGNLFGGVEGVIPFNALRVVHVD